MLFSCLCRLCLSASLLALASLPAIAGGDRLTSLEVALGVGKDAVLTVYERVRADNRGGLFEDGVLRSFDVVRRGTDGALIPFGIDLVSVTLDGAPVKAHLEPDGDRAHVLVDELGGKSLLGEHTLVLVYRAENRIQFGAAGQEANPALPPHTDGLTWDVLGMLRAIPVDKVSVFLLLPDNAMDSIRAVSARIGYPGQTGTAAEPGWTRATPNTVAATRPVYPGETFVARFAWAQGLVQRPAPGIEERLYAGLSTHEKLFLAALSGFFAVFYLGVWLIWRKRASAPLPEAGAAPAGPGPAAPKAPRQGLPRALNLVEGLLFIAAALLLPYAPSPLFHGPNSMGGLVFMGLLGLAGGLLATGIRQLIAPLRGPAWLRSASGATNRPALIALLLGGAGLLYLPLSVDPLTTGAMSVAVGLAYGVNMSLTPAKT